MRQSKEVEILVAAAKLLTYHQWVDVDGRGSDWCVHCQTDAPLLWRPGDDLGEHKPDCPLAQTVQELQGLVADLTSPKCGFHSDEHGVRVYTCRDVDGEVDGWCEHHNIQIDSLFGMVAEKEKARMDMEKEWS